MKTINSYSFLRNSICEANRWFIFDININITELSLSFNFERSPVLLFDSLFFFDDIGVEVIGSVVGGDDSVYFTFEESLDVKGLING